jgi:hypothetical protein
MGVTIHVNIRGNDVANYRHAANGQQSPACWLSFEELNSALVSLRGGPGREGAKIAAFAGLRIGVTRIEAILSRSKFSDHRLLSWQIAVALGDGRLREFSKSGAIGSNIIARITRIRSISRTIV